MAEFRTSIEISADPDTVFDHLVTEAGLTAWMGTHAALDATTGGDFTVDVAGSAIRGRYVVVDRPHRVVVTWGMAGSEELPPGASTVTFALTPIVGGTRLDLTHADLPDPQVPGHADGWGNFVPRLRAVAEGTDPGIDRWRPEPDGPVDAERPRAVGHADLPGAAGAQGPHHSRREQ